MCPLRHSQGQLTVVGAPCISACHICTFLNGFSLDDVRNSKTEDVRCYGTGDSHCCLLGCETV